MAALGGSASKRTEDFTTVDQSPWAYGRWVSRPVQSRAEQSFYSILDATERLLNDYTWASLSVQGIVAAAGASVGSFYNRFEDKQALLHCLEDRLGMDFEVSLKALIEECDRSDALLSEIDGILVSLFMRLCDKRGGVIRALDLAQRLQPAASATETDAGEAVVEGAAADGQQPQGRTSGFSGIGDRFDGALRAFAEYLAPRHSVFGAVSAPTVHRALRETFWLTRENLLYGAAPADPQTMHHSLRQHLFASLQYPA